VSSLVCIWPPTATVGGQQAKVCQRAALHVPARGAALRVIFLVLHYHHLHISIKIKFKEHFNFLKNSHYN